MRKRAIQLAGAMAVLLLGVSAAAVLRLPAAGPPGQVAKIIFFYAPAALAAMVGAAAALAASLLFLRTKNLQYDALAVSATQVGLVFLSCNLAAGCIWSQAARGIWWTWDPAATSALVCGLIYASYLMLRRAIEEPTQRATFCAVWSIFCFLDAPMAAAAVYRWRAAHPHPPLWAGVPASWIAPLVWNAAGMLAVGVVLLAMRLRQEQAQRQLDSLRRTFHVM